jgi:type V secretory pathway adhesin AidA
MSAPTSDMPPGTRTGASAEHRRRRAPLVLAVSGLAVVAIAVGVSLAVATRPITRPAPAAADAVPPTIATEQGAAEPAAKPDSSAAPAAAGAAASALEDGDHDAYITKVDSANDRIVVDVVQVFHDDAAVRAAIADGKSASDAKYLTTWVRNENPRLRTLPLAGDLQVKLRDACGEDDPGREALLTRLAANASLDGTYYYTLTVRDGAVERIQERLAVNAC